MYKYIQCSPTKLLAFVQYLNYNCMKMYLDTTNLKNCYLI